MRQGEASRSFQHIIRAFVHEHGIADTPTHSLPSAMIVSSNKKTREDTFSRIKRHKKLLSSLYHIAPNGELQDLMLQEDRHFPSNQDYSAGKNEDDSDDVQASDDVNEEEKPIPKPDNITVTLFSWTPPSIRVGWDFHDPHFVIPASTPFPNYPVPSSSASETSSQSSESGSLKNEEDRKLRLEAFRIIYHPTVTK